MRSSGIWIRKGKIFPLNASTFPDFKDFLALELRTKRKLCIGTAMRSQKKQLPFGATQCTRHGPTDLAPVSVADDVDPSNASSYGFILLDGQIMLGKGALL